MAEPTSSGTSLRLVLAQLDFTVGAVGANVEKMVQACERARDEYHADLVVFPELALTGYPPEDLLLNPSLHLRVLHGLEELKRRVQGVAAVFGYPHHASGGYFNSASVVADGKLIATCHKQHLPNYGVFDEQRYFSSGEGYAIAELRGVPLGITICEDLWSPGPIAAAAAAGACAIVNINASPYHLGKWQEREAVVRQRVEEVGVPLIYLNLVGGQDELVFDGESFVMDADGQLTHRFPAFVEGLHQLELAPEKGGMVPRNGKVAAPLEDAASVYQALVCGVGDYVEKNGFDGVVIGLSGGIDSALTAAIAADAVGGHRVVGVSMPSSFSSEHSKGDAADLARRLGADYRVQPIAPMVDAFLQELALTGVPEENLQARVRGVILMAISNREGHLVIAPGNKSELATGYATIYDAGSIGGFAPLKDVDKSRVWALARWRNTAAAARGEVEPIPVNSIEKPPSAELRPGQTDQDSLPPYDLLDEVLDAYVEHAEGRAELLARGFDESVVDRVLSLVDRAEWKRRQYPPGPKVTALAFGRDRRLPITSRWREKVES